jgi:hypothetical protein
MPVEPTRDETLQPPRERGMQRTRFGFGFEFGENTGSGPRHARLRAVLP